MRDRLPYLTHQSHHLPMFQRLVELKIAGTDDASTPPGPSQAHLPTCPPAKAGSWVRLPLPTVAPAPLYLQR